MAVSIFGIAPCEASHFHAAATMTFLNDTCNHFEMVIRKLVLVPGLYAACGGMQGAGMSSSDAGATVTVVYAATQPAA